MRRRVAAVLLLGVTPILCRPAFAADNQPDLGPLVQLLGQIDDAEFQLDLLKGMREGLRGRKRLEMPKDWPTVYPKLAKSPNTEVRELARLLALVFDDPQVLKSLRETVMDGKADAATRRTALEALIEKRVDDLAPSLQQLLDDNEVRRIALRGLAAYDDANTPRAVLDRFAKFSPDEKQDAVSTLASRPEFALALLNAVEKKRVERSEISAFTARQIQNLGDEQVQDRLREVWGEIRQTAQNKQELIAKYKQDLTPKNLEKADLSNGRVVFSKTCMKCHKLYGFGGGIGPDLTGSNRNNLDYVLENVLDPSAAIGKDFQLTNITTIDGRLIAGIIAEQNARSVTIQTVNERVVLPREDIEETQIAPISMMPEGQLDMLTKDQIRDLVAYLATSSQVPLPPGVEVPEVVTSSGP